MAAKRFIFKPEVLDRVGVTYTTLWNWMREGKFPRARDVGGKSAWLENEIDDYFDSCPIRPLKGDEGAGLPHEPYKKPNRRRLGDKKKKTKNKYRPAREQRVEA